MQRLHPADHFRRVAHLVGDDFKISRPDCFCATTSGTPGQRSAPTTAYRAWFAEAYVRTRCGDVLVDGAPGSTQEFLSSTLPFATAAYPPVELVTLAYARPTAWPDTSTRTRPTAGTTAD